MKKRIITLILSFATVLSLFGMTSCYSMGGGLVSRGDDDDYITRDELAAMLEDIKGGVNNYDIDINSASGENVLAASRAVLSVVSVYCGFGSSYSSAGSGVIYKLDKQSGDAYIITNYHVVYNEKSSTANGISDNIQLFLYGQELNDYAIPATYVGGSMGYDLAVLKVAGSDVLKYSNAMEAEFADSGEVTLLETTIAIGNPESLGISATVGYLSVDSEYITIHMTTTSGALNPVQLRVMRVDAAVNSGNSGGGLFNSKGELIGIVNAKIADTSVENIGYAIPSNIAKAITENIIYYSDKQDVPCVYRCLLGITVTSNRSYTEYDTETGRILKREDVVISEINKNSFATGRLLVGDIIKSVTVDGVEYETRRMYEVIDSMLNARVGSEVVFAVDRDGTPMDVSFVIDQSTLTAVK